jgi:hypothetical protein
MESCQLGIRSLYVVLVLGCIASRLPAADAAPLVYVAPAYESPVRGDPDDLLLIPGYGLSATDTVVYQAVSNTNSVPAHPTSVPTSSTSTLGLAAVVNAADVPYSLAVRLPTAIQVGQSYALWVHDAADEWSAPLLINDARPLWITPDSAFSTAQTPGVARELKAVGKNLQSAPESTVGTLVRLIGNTTGMTYTLSARNTNDDPEMPEAVERYAAVVTLPDTLAVDQYTVEVSRDGVSWVSLLGNAQAPPQLFTVLADPVAKPVFQVSDPQFADPVSGPCQPNDNVDDTYCIIMAVRKATQAGGGTVVLGPGSWTMSNSGNFGTNIQYSDRANFLPGQCPASVPRQTCGVSWYGVLLPAGVDLQGSGPTGAGATIIDEAVSWNAPGQSLSLFVAQGSNTISGIAFVDHHDYRSNTSAPPPTLKLGVNWWFAHIWSVSDPVTVSHVTITNNLFDKPWVAVGNGGLPMDHIYVTDNIFGGAYVVAFAASGDGNDTRNLVPAQRVYPYMPYHLSDSIVTRNAFYPSSFQQSPDVGTGGLLAANIDSGVRVDFSDNQADGTVAQYLYDPLNDPRGWRGAFFFTPGWNQEMTLVSNNYISCPGDKNGDGEAIVYDGRDYHGGVPDIQRVTTSASWTDPLGNAGTTVTLQGTIITSFTVGSPAVSVDVSSDPTAYYRGFWAQIVQGKGKGQWRKIESVALGSNDNGSTVTFNVAPAFDVLPDTTSRVAIQFVYWQNATVSNFIDQRTPGCTKANARYGGSGGLITYWSATADSAIAGNQQYDTNGIVLNHTNKDPGGVHLATSFQSSNDIRGNLLQGAYHWNWTYNGGHGGGIQLGYGTYICATAPCRTPPPDLGFGITIAHNAVIQVDATARNAPYPPIGAIGLNSGWSTGPADATGLSMPQLGAATLIFQNSVQLVSNAISGSPPAPHVGIGVNVEPGTTPHSATVWHSTLYANTCDSVDIPASDFGIGTARVCPSGASSTCECMGTSNVDVGVSATSAAGATPDGGNVTYTVLATNHSPSVTASGVSLSVEPSEGVQINAGSFTTSKGMCDATVNVCLLGSLAPGQTATITLTASQPATASGAITFAVGHGEPDAVVTNDSVTVPAGG